ncbi:MAG: hypothetical protein OEV01_14535 [Nitrospira sp.]|nr:hypothetical protein [Nitrospira sp.]MDH4304973.1 hypothetical protein [Nitrospira sp.]MDH5194665.1 hypothetical protein [Nitrospira sp.]
MALIDDVKVVCDRLAPLGWQDLLLKVTGGQLNIVKPTEVALKTELTKTLTSIDRTVTGFTDFSLSGAKAITAGSPAGSLLYHALASPNVTAGISGFPTLKEIEMVENYVFGAQPPTLESLKSKAGLTGSQRLSVVLFAYEYRPARDTCTGRQADMVFSRTGVSRVGTRPAFYDARNRGFQAQVADDPFAFRVCPSRFAAFLAVKRKGSDDVTIMRTQPGDSTRDFWVPIHKLFNGTECLAGLNLEVELSAFHYNDKIRRTRAVTLRMARVPATSPFQFSTGIAELSTDTSLGAGIVTPVPHPRLIEPATVNGQLLTYRVPPGQKTFAALEPGATSGVDGSEIRPAPAYVHARTQVRNGALIDLNNDPLRPDVNDTVSTGNYRALHYVDFTGDGQISATVSALTGKPEVAASVVPCYSLVAAPDFFTSAGQRELFERVPDNFWGVPPVPLCDTRLPANLQMPGNRFSAAEKTISAIVSLLGPAPGSVTIPQSFDADRHSCLPDDCAGVFAPGWDVSTDRTRVAGTQVQHLAAYGLGSPFPEDTKLCAALSTFWPAVAPDASRAMSPNTGNPNLRATVAPLTDEEIGQAGALPWDGVTGPKVTTFNGEEFLDCEKFLHVDYVKHALEGRFTPRLTAQVSSEEYMLRMQAIAKCYSTVGGDRNMRFVVSFRKISAGDPELQRAQLDTSTVLSGEVYRIDMILGGEETEHPHPSDFRRSLLPIQDRQVFLVGPRIDTALRKRANQAVWSRVS